IEVQGGGHARNLCDDHWAHNQNVRPIRAKSSEIVVKSERAAGAAKSPVTRHCEADRGLQRNGR
ncbi:MAG TPA: hypothetical protein VIJ21_08560, partial [Solirubrobacterales bacterium]